MKGDSDQQFNDELNDKLNQLWTGAAEKRRELIKNKTPSYSRRSDLSELNVSAPAITGIVEKQVIKLRQKLQNQVQIGKHKDLQIQNLKKMISQLSNQKKFLLTELEQVQHQDEQNCVSVLNESSIQCQFPQKKNNHHNNSPKKIKGKTNLTKMASAIIEEKSNMQNVQNLEKKRLVELLRSTSDYRSFVFYYDSHQLSYLKRLNKQHTKNCSKSPSDKQKANWAPIQILKQMRELNDKQEIGLSQSQQELIISKIKRYYQHNQSLKLKLMKQRYEQKMKRIMRQTQNIIPYQLVQICKAKERELSKQVGRKRNNTTVLK